ncbi:hypothetical protein ACFOEE_19425 [Pseudoalteromonas fenneropenaei]|uniref:Big-1 domain-containing protein n=1 Tax=Pseudoalteromonas fenneropenaei TaxID=1737459 RepID=A0ABV7CPQ7_9GAMM
MPIIRWFTLLALSFLLAACGGGGSIEKDGTTTDNSAYSLTLKGQSQNTGETSNQLSGESPLLVVAHLTKDGNPLGNVRVIFSVDDYAVLSPESGSVLTDSQGHASIVVKAIATAGAGEITANATIGEKTYSGKFLFSSSGGTDPTTPNNIVVELDVVDAEGNIFNAANPITKANPGTVKATLTNKGEAFKRQLVSFEARYTGKIEPEIGTGITDDNGLAVITLSSGESKGAGQVIATFTDEDGNEYRKTAVFYSSGDAAVIDGSALLVDIQLYSDCPAGWDENRDTVALNTLAAQKGCKATNKVTSTALVDVLVEVRDSKSGDGAANTLTTLTSDLGRILPESGKTITDKFGFALLKLQPSLQGGAGILTAQVNNVTKTLAFETGSQEIELVISNGLNKDSQGKYIPLGAGETTLIRVEIRDQANALITSPLDVEFSSGCSQLGTAVIDPKTTSVGGIALSTYRNTGCQISTGDEVVVTVSKGGSTETSQVNIPVAAAKVTSIQFIDVTEKVLAIKGAGGKNRKEFSEVSFKLINSIGGNVANQRMDFRLVGQNGDTYLSSNSIDTDSQGIARVIVNAGNVPSTFVVQACYIPESAIPSDTNNDVTCWQEQFDACQVTPKPANCPAGTLTLLAQDTVINSISSRLAVTSGLPVQSSFSVSAETINSETGDFTNVQVPVTVNAADRYGNFVPDGTQVYLTTEGGAVGSVTGDQYGPTLDCEVIDGRCEVVWVSQNRVPFSEAQWGNQIHSYNPKKLYQAKRSYLIGLGNSNPSEQQVKAVANASLPASVLEGTRNCDRYFSLAAPCTFGILNAKDDKDGVPLRGRVTLLAKTLGEENFNDVNGNGIFDYDATTDRSEFASVFDSSEAFRDDNENGVYEGIHCLSGQNNDPCDPIYTNAGHFEQLFDTDGNGAFTGPDSKYNGLSCSEAAFAAGKCTKTLVDVWKSVELVMSGSNAFYRFVVAKGTVISVPTLGAAINYSIADTCSNLVVNNQLVLQLEPSDQSGFCDIAFLNLSPIIFTVDSDSNGTVETYDIGLRSLNVALLYSDINNNPLPAETSISITSDNGKYSGPSSDELGNTNTTFALGYSFNLSREVESNDSSSGTVQFIFETPSGTKTTASLTVADAG